jgi:hypothetical protein
MLGNTRLAFSALAVALFTQTAPAVNVPSGQTLQVQIERDSHMRIGESVRARTVYPVYLDNQIVIPSGSELSGTVTALEPAPKKTRTNAKLSGDFTPLHTPRIQFDHLVLPGGSEISVNTLPASGGLEVVRFHALSAAGKHESVAKKLWADAIGREKETVRTFTAPGKKDRARRMLYSELPYHPELITQGSQFEVQLASGLSLPAVAEAADQGQPSKGIDSSATLAAELLDDISSDMAVPGTKIRALVTEPLFNKEQQLQVPQGSVLLGEITQAHAAGKWGKGGVLRFSFRELQVPAGFVQKVHGAPVAVDTDQNANLQIDAEGGVKPGPKGVAVPLVMGLLAASAVHEDEASVLHTGGASNGFALIGRIAALAAKSPYVGAGFGFYGTGRAVYSRWIAHGEDVSFPKHTRIEVVVDPERINSLKPEK